MPRQYTRRDAILVIGPSIAYIPLKSGKVALIDAEDAARLSRSAWHESKSGYAACSGRFERKGQMQRILLDHPEGLQVDHINRNPLDNRRANLRTATYAQQRCNQPAKVNNKSGYKGVFKNKSSSWTATVQLNGIVFRRQGFRTAEEAFAVRTQIAKEMHGDFYS